MSRLEQDSAHHADRANGSRPPAIRIRCGRRSATGREHDGGRKGATKTDK